MSLLKALSTSSVVAQAPTYVDDVYFASKYITYTSYTNGGTLPSEQFPVPINAAKGDLYWDNVAVLLKCDPDVKDVKTNTALTLLGDNSVTTGTHILGRAIRLIANSSNPTRSTTINFGTLNFNQSWCIDFRVGMSALGDGTGTVYGTANFTFNIGNTVNGIQIVLSCDDGNLGSFVANVWVAGNFYQATGAGTMNNASQTGYFKVSCDGSLLKVFFNGSLFASSACVNASAMTTTGAYLSAVAEYVGANASYTIDEFRITLGSARVGEETNLQLESFPEQDMTNAGRCLVWFSPNNSDTSSTLTGMYTNATTNRVSTMRRSSGTSETASIVSRCTALPTSIAFCSDGLYGSSTVTKFMRLFKEKAGFMAIATGGNTATLTHSLGSTPAMAIIQDINGSVSPVVFHKDLTGGINGNRLVLSSTASQVSSTNAAITATTINCTDIYSGGDAIAYLFADDPSPNGIIRCTSFTTIYDGSATVDVGWEVQTVLIKSVNTTQEWRMVDIEREFTQNETSVWFPNKASSPTGQRPISIFAPTTTGFTVSAGAGLVAGETYIVLAIRRSNKPPTSGTQVFNAIARTGTGTVAPISVIGFSPDLVISEGRSSQNGAVWYDKTRGVNAALRVSNTGTAPEYTSDYTAITSFDSNGITVGADSFFGRINASGSTYVNWYFKRAVGVFDIVNYVGVAGSSQTIPHDLGVKPELMIVKCRNFNGYSWAVYAEAVGATHGCQLNNTGGFFSNSLYWNNTEPTSSTFTIGSGDDTKPSAGASMVAYLFASLAGVSKVGSYTGNGSSLNVNCGFAAGARFVMIKRWDTNGDWYVWDYVRGIVAGNDSHLSLNTTDAEVTTDDSIDPLAAGFTVNQDSATNINVNGATYIFLAFS